MVRLRWRGSGLPLQQVIPVSDFGAGSAALHAKNNGQASVDRNSVANSIGRPQPILQICRI